MIVLLADGFGPSAATLAREVKAAAAGRANYAHVTRHVSHIIRFTSGRQDGHASLFLDSYIQGTIQTRSSDSTHKRHALLVIQNVTLCLFRQDH
jgi:hypothetical protein